MPTEFLAKASGVTTASSLQAKDSEGSKLLASKIEFRNTVAFCASFDVPIFNPV